MNIVKKLYSIIDSQLFFSFSFLFLLLIFGMFLETLSIGMVIPFLDSILNPSSMNYLIYDFLLNASNLFNIDNLIVVAAIVLFLVFLLKILFLILVAWFQNQLIFKINLFYNKKLFLIYLQQSYVFHVSKKSSEIIRNLVNEVDSFTYAFKVFFILVTEILVVLGITTLMLVVNPKATLFIFFTIIICSCIFFLFFQKLILKWGEERQKYEALRIKDIQHSLGAIKEVKIYGKSNFFKNNYSFNSFKKYKSVQYSGFLSNLPRLWIELIVISSFVILFFLYLNTSNDSTMIITSLALYGAASFRLLPSASRILNCMQDLRYLEPAINLVNDELNLNFNNKKDKSFVFKNLKIHKIYFEYPKRKKTIFENLSFEINKGDFIGIVGPSGSGKTSLINIILGLLIPKSYNYLINDERVDLEKINITNLFGYVPQKVFLLDDTIENNILFGNKVFLEDDKILNSALKNSKLDQFIQQLPNKLNTVVGENGIQLSGGQIQRIGIARALYNSSQILILDESTNSLDKKNEESIINFLKELNMKITIILITHKLDNLKHCNKIFKIDNKKLTTLSNND